MRSKLAEDDPGMRLTSLKAASPRQPPAMRMPDELLDEVFKNVFDPMGSKPLRERVRIYVPLSLVCKVWQRVAAPHAWVEVSLDVVKEVDAVAYLDPAEGAGAHLLSLVKLVELSATEPLIEDAGSGEEHKEEKGGQHTNALPARRPVHLDGPADDETSTLPIVASVARILAKCSNLLAMTIDQHLESVSRKVTVEQDPGLMWPNLTHLHLTWNDSFINLLPVLARLSRLQTLTDLTLLFDLSDEDDNRRGTMTQELVDKYPIQPLERLQSFKIRSLAETPIGSNAVLQLLSPHAPLDQVIWGGYIPPGLCKQLSYGTSEIEDLTFTWMLPTLNLADQLLPQLLELGRRPIRCLTFDVGPVSPIPPTQFMPPVTDILKNLPHGVWYSRATDMVPMFAMGLHQAFATSGADFAAIKARPTVRATFHKKGKWGGSLDGKHLIQVGTFYVSDESDDGVILRAFGRFGDPNVEGDVTEWMLLDMAVEGDSEEK